MTTGLEPAAGQRARRSIGEATVEELAQSLRGELVRPGDADYDDARGVWNSAFDRKPALVVRCAGVADVIRTVGFARSEGLTLAVRGGGHSVAGFSTCDDGIVIDLSPMKGLWVDPARRRARAQPGLTWAEFDHETQEFGLAVTGGLVSTTGIGGFTLGGGIGWLVRHWGPTVDSLVAADLVTGDGQLVRASEDENAELFWALRGGGGNFGVVTSFEYELHQVGPTVFSGLVFYPGGEADQVLRGYLDACSDAPDELTTLLNLTTAPPAPFLPESVHGRPVVAIGGVWSGLLEAGEAATRPFRALGTVITDLFSPHAYVGMQQALDALYPRGLHNYFRSAFFDDVGGAAEAALLSSYASVPNELSELHVHHLGGAMARVPADATAFATRDKRFILNVVARAPGPGGLDQAIEWAREATAPLGSDAAAYVNFTGEGTEDRVRASYPPQTYARLVAIKDHYDPENRFHLNQNIRPTQQE